MGAFERAVRVIKIRGMLLGIVFAAVAVGFAAAMPGAMSVSDVEAEQDTIELIEAKKAKPAGSKVKSPEPKESETEETEGSEAEAEDDNHGSVVSAVARCDVKGRWHGEAVWSIAQDEDATLADAEAACDAAKAAAAGARKHGRSAEARSRAESHGGGKPATAGPPAHAAPPADAGPPAGKGKGKKP